MSIITKEDYKKNKYMDRIISIEDSIKKQVTIVNACDAALVDTPRLISERSAYYNQKRTDAMAIVDGCKTDLSTRRDEFVAEFNIEVDSPERDDFDSTITDMFNLTKDL